MLSTRRCDERKNSQLTTSIRIEPSTKPSSGEITMNATIFSRPPQIGAWMPPLQMPAPTRPPIKACDELDGRPKYQVMRFQAMAPSRSEEHTSELQSLMRISYAV